MYGALYTHIMKSFYHFHCFSGYFWLFQKKRMKSEKEFKSKTPPASYSGPVAFCIDMFAVYHLEPPEEFLPDLPPPPPQDDPPVERPPPPKRNRRMICRRRSRPKSEPRLRACSRRCCSRRMASCARRSSSSFGVRDGSLPPRRKKSGTRKHVQRLPAHPGYKAGWTAAAPVHHTQGSGRAGIGFWRRFPCSEAAAGPYPHAPVLPAGAG